MLITTKILNESDILQCVATAGEDYGDNLKAEVSHYRGNQYRLKVGVKDSRGPGARTSATGRRGPYACWHAFRDIFTEILSDDDNATIRTSLTVYRGWDDFQATYPATAYQNVGSMIYPAYMDELCECD